MEYVISSVIMVIEKNTCAICIHMQFSDVVTVILKIVKLQIETLVLVNAYKKL